MTFKITEIGLIMVVMGIGALAVYSVNSFNPVGPKGIILFDLLISVLLTIFVQMTAKHPEIVNFSN